MPRRRIDAHMHFYDHRRFRYSGTEPGSSPAFMGDISQLAADFLPLDYKADFAGLGTIGFVHVETGVDLADARAETLWLQSLDKAAGRPDAIVAKINLMADNLREELSWLQRQSMAKAVRQIVSWHDDPYYNLCSHPHLLKDKEWLAGYAQLEEFDLNFDL